MVQVDDYILGRSLVDSVRLDAQHLLWKLHKPYLLHPKIPITENMKIAELGTGTAIWLLDISQQLPATVQLHGFDISDAQFPHKEQCPPNMTLGLLDSLVDPPPSLTGKYDVVHLRMWASNLQSGDTGPIIRHVRHLLKSGGFIQWEDADLIHQVVKGDIAKTFQAKMNDLCHQVGLDYSWVSDLPSRLRQEGFFLLQSESSTFEPGLVQLCTNTYLLALREILQGIKRTHKTVCTTDHEMILHDLSIEARKGVIYNWSPIAVLAQCEK